MHVAWQTEGVMGLWAELQVLHMGGVVVGVGRRTVRPAVERAPSLVRVQLLSDRLFLPIAPKWAGIVAWRDQLQALPGWYSARHRTFLHRSRDSTNTSCAASPFSNETAALWPVRPQSLIAPVSRFSIPAARQDGTAETFFLILMRQLTGSRKYLARLAETGSSRASSIRETAARRNPGEKMFRP